MAEKIVDDKVIVELPKDWLPKENGASAEGPQGKDADAPKRTLSPGEVVFDKVTYTGISFVLNEAISLWMTDKFLYGSWKKHCDNLSTKLAPMVSKGKSLTEGKKDAHGIIMAFMLNMGGNFLVPVMKKAEDYKLPIVTWLNHKIDRWRGKVGDKELTPENVAERDKEVAAHIDREPDQTWGAMIPARVLVPTQSMLFSKFVIGGERTKRIENWVGDKVSKTLTRQNSKMLQALGKNKRFIGFSKLIPFETLFCAGGAVTFYLTSRLFAKRSHDKKQALLEANGKAEANAPVPPPDAASSASASGGTEDKQERSLITETSPKDRVLARQNLDNVIGSLPSDEGGTKMLDKVLSRQAATADKEAPGLQA